MATPRQVREPRLISRCKVEFDRPSGAVEAETEDVCAHGLYIRTDALLPVGEETDVRLLLPNGTLLGLRARVAHLLTPAAARMLGRHPGMGFELVGPETPSRQLLVRHLDAVRTEPATRPTTGARLAVVDAGEPLRARMQRGLERAGYHVSAFDDAAELLHACATWRPAAVIAGASLPGMTGADLAYAMSEHATLSEVPLVITGDDGDLGRLEAYRAGVRDYVPLPFLEEELVLRVHRVLTTSLAPVAPIGLRGNLGDIGLPTLLSLFEYERKSGVLLLVRRGELARVFVDEGRCVKIETGGPLSTLRPRDQLMRLLDWFDGGFEFTPMDVEGEGPAISITEVLLEHARRADESKPTVRNG